ALGERAIVDVQNPVRLNRYTEPQPDIAVLQYRADFYRQEFPTAKDTLLVIEVSQSPLMYDRDVKVPLYAAAGIPEIWIENLQAELLLVYRDLEGHSYQTSLALDPE